MFNINSYVNENEILIDEIQFFESNIPSEMSQKEIQQEIQINKELIGLGILKIIEWEGQQHLVPSYVQVPKQIPRIQIPVKSIPYLQKKQKPNDLCECGSNRKFKKCHGRSIYGK